MFREQKSDEIEYNGKKINKCYAFNRKGEYILNFRFIDCPSSIAQAIVIHWRSFEGKIFINGEKISISKGSLPQTVFSEKTTAKQFEIKVVLNGGEFIICNGSDLFGDQSVWRTLYGGCAMIIEPIGENTLRFYCNDHEEDDDFNDLIFELDIIEANSASDDE
ncbi:MAG: hypothetical protein J6L81_08205 [Clostridia bacterium]|nr:hypothetical protein [Clostridia bacterium]